MLCRPAARSSLAPCTSGPRSLPCFKPASRPSTSFHRSLAPLGLFNPVSPPSKKVGCFFGDCELGGDHLFLLNDDWMQEAFIGAMVMQSWESREQAGEIDNVSESLPFTEELKAHPDDAYGGQPSSSNDRCTTTSGFQRPLSSWNLLRLLSLAAVIPLLKQSVGAQGRQSMAAASF